MVIVDDDSLALQYNTNSYASTSHSMKACGKFAQLIITGNIKVIIRVPVVVNNVHTPGARGRNCKIYNLLQQL